MGVEKFYFAIKNLLGVPTLTLDNEINNATYIYIDFNAVIHRISEKTIVDKNLQLIKLYHENVMKSIKYLNETKENIKYIIIQEVINEIENIEKLAINSKEIYVAFDGIPELSKCAEQKHRKISGYMKTLFESELIKNYGKNIYSYDTKRDFYEREKFSFSKGEISSQSQFMRTLKEQMIQKFAGNRKIVISGTEEYGEGEKKIMFRIFNDNVIGNDDNILILSPDADVIQLACVVMYKFGVRSIFPKIFVYNKDLINIELLANYIANRVDPTITDRQKILLILRDFLCIFTFFGNDFLPKILSMSEILSLSNIEDNIVHLINLYKKVINNNEYGSIVDSDSNFESHKINFEKFYKLLNILVQYNDGTKIIEKEKELYTQYINKKNNGVKKTRGEQSLDRRGNPITLQENKLLVVSYYDCCKYIFQNEYLFYIYIDYFNNSVLPEYIKIPNIKKYGDSMRNIGEHVITTLLKNLKIDGVKRLNPDYNTLYIFSNLIEEKKWCMDDLGMSNFIDNYSYGDGSKLLRDFDFALIAFRNKKSIWKIIFAEYNYNDSIPTTYNPNLVKDYLDGFSWTINWYFDRMMDPSSNFFISTWFYRWKNAPFLKNILDYINQNNIVDININDFKLVKIKDYFVGNEQKMYTEPTNVEKEKIKSYTERICHIIHNSHLGDQYYLNDDIQNLKSRIEENGWTINDEGFVDCHDANYFEKCHIEYGLLEFEEFIRQYRVQEDVQVGGIKKSLVLYYMKKHKKYQDKIESLE
jgi:hypothetical protein